MTDCIELDETARTLQFDKAPPQPPNTPHDFKAVAKSQPSDAASSPAKTVDAEPVRQRQIAQPSSDDQRKSNGNPGVNETTQDFTALTEGCISPSPPVSPQLMSPMLASEQNFEAVTNAKFHIR